MRLDAKRPFGPEGALARRREAEKLRVPAAVEGRYVGQLRSIMRQVHGEVMKNIDLERDSGVRHDADLPQDWHALGLRITAATQAPVRKSFDAMSKGIIRSYDKEGKFLGWVEKPQETTHPALAGISYEHPAISKAVDKARDENVRLIQSATKEYLDDVRETLEENAGLAVEDLAKKLNERAGVSESKAELIARDQTLGLHGAINKSRQESAGFKYFTWVTAGDDRVRDSHADLDGEVFSWDDLPEVDGEEAYPGSPINCRCVATPSDTGPEDEGEESDE